MALNKTIYTERGEAVSYWKLMRVNTEVLTAYTEAMLYGFENKEDRQAYLQVPKLRRVIPLELQESFTDVYDAIKETPEFEGATDC